MDGLSGMQTAAPSPKNKLGRLRTSLSRTWQSATGLAQRPTRWLKKLSLQKHRRVVVPEPRHLPPELVRQIVGYLHDDKRSLRNCSLVCHGFASIAQDHLFETVTIKKGKIKRALALFVDQSPHLAAHIQVLTLEAGLDASEVMQEIVHGEPPRLRPNAILLSIAPRATKLRELSLKDFAIDKDCLDVLASSFPALTRLDIFDCWFRCNVDLDRFLRSHPSLKSIRCGRLCSFYGVAAPDTKDTVGPPLNVHMLKVTEIYSPSPMTLVPWLIGHVSPEFLVHNVYRLDQFANMNHSLVGLHNLKHLHILFYRWSPGDQYLANETPSALTLGPNLPPSITTLTVDGKLFSMKLVVYILAHLDPQEFRRLSTLNIYAHFIKSTMAEVPSEMWSRADQALSALPSLVTVNVHNGCTHYDDGIHVGLEAVESHLPVLAKRKIMTFCDKEPPF